MNCEDCKYDNPQAVLYCYSCGHYMGDTRKAVANYDFVAADYSPNTQVNADVFRATNAMSKLRLSIRRALSVAFAIGICAVGLYVAAAPVWSDWKSTRASAAEYEIGISDLQYAVKSTFRGANIADFPKGVVFTRFVTIPDSAKNWIRSEMSDRTPGFPETMSDAEIMHDLESSFLLPRPTFHLGSSVRAHAWPVFVGLALFASGLSIAEQRRRRSRLGSADASYDQIRAVGDDRNYARDLYGRLDVVG